MNLITITVMACMNVNSMWFCAQPLDTRKEVTIKKPLVESLEPIKYRFSKNLSIKTIAQMIYNGKDKIDGEEVSGCRLFVGSRSYEYEFPCYKLKKVIKFQ